MRGVRVNGGAEQLVIPAKAGISPREGAAANLHEIPAFAGMTN